MLSPQDEDEMLSIPTNIVPCRGREGLRDTTVQESFTGKELDLLAPLAPKDSKEMGEFGTPDPETIERLKKRILAARRLKYGN